MLREKIIEEIETSGPIGFDRFMEVALYDGDAGYFATGALRSDRAGDFLTSSEVSPLFGETIASFVAAERERIGEPFTVAEVGGGSGSLLRPLLDALEPGPDRVVAVEASAAARAALAARVPEATLLDGLPAMRGVVIANEVVDNLPAALAVRRGNAWVERLVDVDGDRLALVEGEPRSEVTSWAEAHSGPVAEGGQVEVQLAAGEWLRETLAQIEGGALLVFDYGEIAENLEHRRTEGTVRTYRAHHLGPDPLLEPGATDITMDVNFSALLHVAAAAGWNTELLRQDEFLERHGLRDRLDDLRAEELAAARESTTMDRLRLRSQVTEAETLLHPRGLGDFRVLVCRTPAGTAPARR